MYVSIGGPIFLIAVGAILRYATNFDISGVDMDVIGLILMIAGIAALLLSIGLALFNRDDRRTTAYDQGRVDESRRDPPPPR
jgi:hypothetical protein